MPWKNPWRNENKNGKSEDVTTNYILQKGDRKVKDWNEKNLVFDIAFIG